MSAFLIESGPRTQPESCPLCAKNGSRSALPQRCEKKVWHAAGALLIRPNDMGTGSDLNVPPQVTVKVLGYFGET
jgi:hypothetical protein